MEESPERCTRLLARIAARNAKFLSSPIQADQSTAGIAGLRDELREEDIRIVVF